MKFATVTAKCGKSRATFAINLVERTPGVITVQSAFPFSAGDSLNEEARTHVQMNGQYVIAPEYACPHCKGKTFVLCNCGKTTCFDWEDGRSFTCAHCNSGGQPSRGLNAMAGRPGG